jgi:hypothetical protein
MKISRGRPAFQRGEGDTEKRLDERVDGVWWIPGHEDLRSDGTARMFAEGLVRLDLDSDVWRDVLDREADRGPRTVFGETSDGVPMSLHGVRFVGGQTEHFSGRGHVRYASDRLIFGAHAVSEDEVALSQMIVSYRGLREWLLSPTQGSTPPLPVVYPASAAGTDGGDGPPTRVDEWERKLEVAIDDVRIEITAAKRPRTTGRYRTVFDTGAIVRLRSAEPMTLSDWRRNWIEPLRDLVLFGSREQTITLFARGRGPDHSAAEVRVYSPPETTIGPPDHSEYYQRDLLPSGIWGEDGFSELIASWRDLSRRLGSVATELFDVFNTVDVPPLARLLRLTACAEGYHRVLHDAPPFEPKAHKAMVKDMIAALPQDDGTREHYRQRLDFANSQSQRERIRWLVERAAEADDRLEGQARTVTRQLVAWRNSQTHLSERLDAPVLDHLLLLNAVLTYVLEANILLDLGTGGNTRYCLAHGHAWDDPIPSWVDLHPPCGDNTQSER